MMTTMTTTEHESGNLNYFSFSIVDTFSNKGNEGGKGKKTCFNTIAFVMVIPVLERRCVRTAQGLESIV